jgi:hypothetical protein
MSKPKRPAPNRAADLTLAAVAVALGLAAATGYGAWRAVNSDAGDRWSTFGDALLFPGLLVISAVAAMVWLGWKANID